MALSKDPLQISDSDLFSPKVDAFVEQQEFLRRASPDIDVQPLVVKVIYSSWFYLALAAGVGGCVGWGIIEPFYTDMDDSRNEWIGILWFPMVSSFIGLFLGGVEGLMCRNINRAMICSAVGFGIGFVGGLIALIGAAFAFGIMGAISAHLSPDRPPGEMPKGIALLVFMIGRGLAWAIASLPAGLGQGIALRERKIILNGILGAVLGGLIGGLMFDPIAIICEHINHSQEANVSRGVGFTMIGIMVGLFVGLVEQWTKTAWLFMKAGPLAGKQFVLFRNPTVIGSSPKADIYLFKDDVIEPRHALIHNRGGRFEIEDCNTEDGTYVNNIPVRKQFLNPGDQIVIGKTVLAFSLRESK